MIPSVVYVPPSFYLCTAVRVGPRGRASDIRQSCEHFVESERPRSTRQTATIGVTKIPPPKWRHGEMSENVLRRTLVVPPHLAAFFRFVPLPCCAAPAHTYTHINPSRVPAVGHSPTRTYRPGPRSQPRCRCSDTARRFQLFSSTLLVRFSFPSEISSS